MSGENPPADQTSHHDQAAAQEQHSKHHKGEAEIEDDDDEHEEVKKPVKQEKSLAQYLTQFGFNDVEEKKHFLRGSDGVRETGGGGGGTFGKKARQRKSKNQTVVYGDVDDYDDDDDYGLGNIADDSDVPVVDDDDVVDLGAEADQDGEGTEDEPGEAPEYLEADEDTQWEDAEEFDYLDEEALEEAEQAALFAAELERERVRNNRIAEIMKKKETLVERYLKTARIMITLRKKNIYLQDYLYHLAFRKGVLRGDPSVHGQHSTMGVAEEGEDEEAAQAQAKLQKKRMQKKNAMMAARFARYLRKTGHLFEDDNSEGHVHHQKHHTTHPLYRHDQKNRLRAARGGGYQFGPRNQRRGTVGSQNKRSMDGDKGKGRAGRKGTNKEKDNAVISRAYQAKRNRKRLSIGELLEKKALVSMQKALDTTNEALDAFERHRCKLKKQQQIIKIAQLLQRQYSGVSILDQERTHLVHFVEQSVTAQNLAKRKALRRQKKNLSSFANKKTGVVNMNHQWTKSLERIRDLRLKKAKLEQDHRLLLIKKVHLWNTWEKRDLTGLESVHDFIQAMASRVTMSRRETENFNLGMEQFRKQLVTLYEALLGALVRHSKAKSMLLMAQRKVKDNVSAASSAKGFSLGDVERMAIENQESHQKLVERQVHLVEQTEKLSKYIVKVAAGHTMKQITWSALRAGRHDLKQLWQMCVAERDSLIKKWKDALKVKRVHRRMFVQVAVVESKSVFRDFLRIKNRVRELEDKKRNLSTRLRQNNAFLRVLNIKTHETRKLIEEERFNQQEKATNDEKAFYKNTIQYRLNPRIPNTIHSVNTKRNSSLHRILEPNVDQLIFRNIGVNPYSVQSKK